MWTPLLSRTPTFEYTWRARAELPDICPVQTLSTTHHQLLPIRSGNVALLLEYTQVLNCLLTATAARLDQDTASLQLDKAFMRIYTCAGPVLLKLWFQKCQQQQQLRSSYDYILFCQLAIIGSCHVKLLTASNDMTTICIPVIQLQVKHYRRWGPNINSYWGHLVGDQQHQPNPLIRE